MTYHKKLIEVALLLEAINEESAREKSIRHASIFLLDRLAKEEGMA